MLCILIHEDDSSQWTTLKPHINASIMDFFASNQPVVLAEQTIMVSDTGMPIASLSYLFCMLIMAEVNADDDDVVALIKELLDTRIRSDNPCMRLTPLSATDLLSRRMAATSHMWCVWWLLCGDPCSWRNRASRMAL